MRTQRFNPQRPAALAVLAAIIFLGPVAGLVRTLAAQDQPANVSASTAPPTTNPDEVKAWQEKMHQQTGGGAKADDPPSPASKPAEPTKPVDPPKPKLNEEALQLAKDLKDQEKIVYNSYSRQRAPDFFRAHWAIVKMLPDFVYIGKEQRDLLAASDKDLKEFFAQNRQAIEDLSEAAQQFHQRLGLDGTNIRMPNRMTAANPTPTKVTGDISLSGSGKPSDVSHDLSSTDRLRIANAEQYLRRLYAEEARRDYVGANQDWQGLADNLVGMYYSQLLMEQDPRFTLTYPITFRFLKELASGKVDIPADPPTGKDAKPAK
ncbi:MAG: hypothetical protein ACREJ2_17810 [Planctomycetota bacterium]